MKSNPTHNNSNKPIWPVIWLLFFVALGARALFALFVLEYDRPIAADEGGYHWRGEILSNGQGLGDSAYRPPFLGITLAPIYALFEPTLEIGRWFMVLVSALCTPLIFFLAQAVTRNRAVSISAAIVWALYPPSIWYSAWVHTEAWSSLLVTISLLLYYQTVSTRNIVFPILLGLSWGFLALNRSIFVFLPMLFFIVIAWQSLAKHHDRLSLPTFLVSLFIFLCSMTPWTLHNYSVHDRFIPHSTQGGTLLLISNQDLDCPRISLGGYCKDYQLLEKTANEGKTEPGIDDIRKTLAFDAIFSHIKNRPKDYLTAILNRGLNFWTFRPDPFDSNWTLNDLIMGLIWLPLIFCLPFSPILRNWKSNLPLIAMILYCFAFVLPFWGSPRFRYPVDPLIIILGMSGALALKDIIVSRLMPLKRH